MAAAIAVQTERIGIGYPVDVTPLRVPYRREDHEKRGSHSTLFTKPEILAIQRQTGYVLGGSRTDHVFLLDRDRGLPERTGHLLHPDKYDPAFGEWLAEDLVPQIEAFLGSEGRHSLFGMLAGGGGRSYTLSWHRDIGKPGAPDEAQFLLRHHGRFVQFNAPLLEGDRFLQIVPASHLRASTSAEIEASMAPHIKT